MTQKSPVDLMVLGLLMEQPLNAYELVRLIESRQLGRLVQISNPAVYKSCKRLFKAKLLDAVTTRVGELPEKRVYSVNRMGHRHFHALMEHFSTEISPLYFSFNSFMWHLDKLEPPEAHRMLEGLRGSLEAMGSWMTRHAEEAEGVADISFAGRRIIRQYLSLLNALTTWINETVEEFDNQQS